MNKIIAAFFFLAFAGCTGVKKTTSSSLKKIPAELLGNFNDDYDISYTINNDVWIQHPGIQYHLISYDSKGEYFIAKNDAGNPSEAGLYTRIDIMHFQGMEPFTWGFCLTAYKAKSIEEAIATASADRNNPKKGCGGYPFSRMKRLMK